jgi:undecaprenyl diphosphate synthase
MIWQSAYAEYYVTPTFWPSFNRDELKKAIQAFNQRERRYGLVPGAEKAKKR